MTSVVKVTKANRSALLADPLFVWVGRPSGRLGMKGSPWRNQYRAETCGPTYNGAGQRHAARLYERRCEEALAGRELAIDPERFNEELFLEGIRRLPELKGKRLGCGCGDWEPGQPEIACHAVVLAKLADMHGGQP